MVQALAADPQEFSAAPPLWRDAVVGASVAAMAAAAGLGSHYEGGVAPWLALAAAAATASALWTAHRLIDRAGQSTPSAERDPSPARRVRRATPTAAVANSPAVSTQAPDLRTGEVAAVASSAAPLRAEPRPERPELSAFTPRLPVMANPKPSVAGGTASAPTAAPIAAAVKVRASPPMPATIDPEAQFLQLQSLVRQLAADVEGPRAATSDPDRAVAGAPAPSASTYVARPIEQAPLKVGFGATEQPGSAGLSQRLAEAVAAERLDVLLEPIQPIGDERARHFEISVRFRDADGEPLTGEEVIRVARANGLNPIIDALKLPRVAKVAQRILSRSGSPSDILTALAGTSLADHQFMEAFASAFPEGVPSPIILSFPQADVRSFARVHWSALNALADMGLRFALNDVSDLDMDFELLRARSFVFAKLDATVFLNGLPCGRDTIPAADICRHIKGAGLALIIAGIDDDAQLGRIGALGVPYGQGKLFGGARPVKADILA